eukprot:TRINITY_DN7604_c0_g3_i1.p1 TRINITY_DN7604_c0_g3~~TRINITY_DN7604_c0_g3_i1.p1  ORF type:complete len:2477 (-),score=754.54 TRINITY_DN7604_c0_g3_i1:320-6832(-)
MAMTAWKEARSALSLEQLQNYEEERRVKQREAAGALLYYLQGPKKFLMMGWSAWKQAAKALSIERLAWEAEEEQRRQRELASSILYRLHGPRAMLLHSLKLWHEVLLVARAERREREQLGLAEQHVLEIQAKLAAEQRDVEDYESRVARAEQKQDRMAEAFAEEKQEMTLQLHKRANANMHLDDRMKELQQDMELHKECMAQQEAIVAEQQRACKARAAEMLFKSKSPRLLLLQIISSWRKVVQTDVMHRLQEQLEVEMESEKDRALGELKDRLEGRLRESEERHAAAEASQSTVAKQLLDASQSLEDQRVDLWFKEAEMEARMRSMEADNSLEMQVVKAALEDVVQAAAKRRQQQRSSVGGLLYRMHGPQQLLIMATTAWKEAARMIAHERLIGSETYKAAEQRMAVGAMLYTMHGPKRWLVLAMTSWKDALHLIKLDKLNYKSEEKQKLQRQALGAMLYTRSGPKRLLSMAMTAWKDIGALTEYEKLLQEANAGKVAQEEAVEYFRSSSLAHKGKAAMEAYVGNLQVEVESACCQARVEVAELQASKDAAVSVLRAELDEERRMADRVQTMQASSESCKLAEVRCLAQELEDLRKTELQHCKEATTEKDTAVEEMRRKLFSSLDAHAEAAESLQAERLASAGRFKVELLASKNSALREVAALQEAERNAAMTQEESAQDRLEEECATRKVLDAMHAELREMSVRAAYDEGAQAAAAAKEESCLLNELAHVRAEVQAVKAFEAEQMTKAVQSEHAVIQQMRAEVGIERQRAENTEQIAAHKDAEIDSLVGELDETLRIAAVQLREAGVTTEEHLSDLKIELTEDFEVEARALRAEIAKKQHEIYEKEAQVLSALAAGDGRVHELKQAHVSDLGTVKAAVQQADVRAKEEARLFEDKLRQEAETAEGLRSDFKESELLQEQKVSNVVKELMQAREDMRAQEQEAKAAVVEACDQLERLRTSEEKSKTESLQVQHALKLDVCKLNLELTGARQSEEISQLMEATHSASLNLHQEALAASEAKYQVLQEEMETRVEQERRLSDKLHEMHKELASARSQDMKDLEAQLAFSEETLGQQVFEGYKTEEVLQRLAAEVCVLKSAAAANEMKMQLAELVFEEEIKDGFDRAEAAISKEREEHQVQLEDDAKAKALISSLTEADADDAAKIQSLSTKLLAAEQAEDAAESSSKSELGTMSKKLQESENEQKRLLEEARAMQQALCAAEARQEEATTAVILRAKDLKLEEAKQGHGPRCEQDSMVSSRPKRRTTLSSIATMIDKVRDAEEQKHKLLVRSLKLQAEAKFFNAQAKKHGSRKQLAGDSFESTQPCRSAPEFEEAVFTTLASKALAGSTKLLVEDATGFCIGDVIKIGIEQNMIVGFASIIVDVPLKQDHPLGTIIQVVKAAPAKKLPGTSVPALPALSETSETVRERASLEVAALGHTAPACPALAASDAQDDRLLHQTEEADEPADNAVPVCRRQRVVVTSACHRRLKHEEARLADLYDFFKDCDESGTGMVGKSKLLQELRAHPEICAMFGFLSMGQPNEEHHADLEKEFVEKVPAFDHDFEEIDWETFKEHYEDQCQRIHDRANHLEEEAAAAAIAFKAFSESHVKASSELQEEMATHMAKIANSGSDEGASSDPKEKELVPTRAGILARRSRRSMSAGSNEAPKRRGTQSGGSRQHPHLAAISDLVSRVRREEEQKEQLMARSFELQAEAQYLSAAAKRCEAREAARSGGTISSDEPAVAAAPVADPDSMDDPFSSLVLAKEGQSGAAAVQETSQSVGNESFLRSVFDRVDLNGDGRISKIELIKVLRKDAAIAEFFGLPQHIRQEDGTRDAMEAWFQKIDSSEDRLLEWREFTAYYAKVRLAGAEGEPVDRQEASLVPDKERAHLLALQGPAPLGQEVESREFHFDESGSSKIAQRAVVVESEASAMELEAMTVQALVHELNEELQEARNAARNAPEVPLGEVDGDEIKALRDELRYYKMATQNQMKNVARLRFEVKGVLDEKHAAIEELEMLRKTQMREAEVREPMVEHRTEEASSSTEPARRQTWSQGGKLEHLDLREQVCEMEAKCAEQAKDFDALFGELAQERDQCAALRSEVAELRTEIQAAQQREVAWVTACCAWRSADAPASTWDGLLSDLLCFTRIAVHPGREYVQFPAAPAPKIEY